MTRRNKRRGWRSTGVLAIFAVVVLAGSSLAYAHWTKTLDLHADINTGNVDLEWSEAFTDDDGEVNDPDRDGSDGVASILFPGPLGSGSTDPSSPSLPGGNFSTRYDKDVAKCVNDGWAPGDMSVFFTASNTYPSYYCTFFTDVTNSGSIPVKATALRVSVFKGGDDVTDFVDFSGEPWVLDTGAQLGADLEFEVEEGILCGTQVDPGESIDVSGWFHIEQGAMQDSDYSIWLHQDFVNWNEWSQDLCTFNGLPLQ